MADQGTVEVSGVKFSWWVTDGDHPVVTVSHAQYGRKTESKSMSAEILARLLAKDLMAEKRPDPSL